MDLKKFIDYCMSFYGPQGLYPMGMTPDEIQKAVRLMDLVGNLELEGDSIDRERVRDIVRVMSAFGFGNHFCMGAQLARLEAGIAVPRIVQRLPDLRLADRPLDWIPVLLTRGLRALHVRVR